MNQWALRAAHRLDCSERCIDCLLLFPDIAERDLRSCDEAARALGEALQAERERVARERELAALNAG